MNQLFKRSSAWMILVGLFLQTATPVVAALQSSTVSSSQSKTATAGKSGAAIKMGPTESASETVDVAEFNVQGLIETVVKDAVEHDCANALSPALVRCYKSISEGETVIDADTLIEAMPELLEYAVTQEKIRAARLYSKYLKAGSLPYAVYCPNEN